ncbi:MAG TPA: hypothetical protein VFB62_04895, partial [Polyangiaceae bacterium]|nr:hypothetical protein [Polyangiaceae bacterium]
MNLKLLRPLLLLLVTAAVAVGCAEERPPINRVQPNALDKAFFVGDLLQDPVDDPEFWTQATIIDVGYGAPGSGLFTSTYTQGVARIKWEITEDVLLGRLTYERIENSDGKGAGPSSTDGQVVAAYRILKHFDIRHAYNPSTGEEQNVIEENTTDRAWYEREYMRVDWSRNENTNAYDFDTLSLLGIYGGIEYSPLAYYVNDPTHEDAPHFDVESGYFDVTNKVFAAPGLIDLSHLGWGIDKIPACWLESDLFGGSFPSGNCNPTEVTIRQSFRRVVDTDFEPSDWDGYRFQSYGGFYVERFGYARLFGMTDQQWHRFLTRYNIWQRSHYYDDPTAMKGAVTCFSPEVDEKRFEVAYQHGDDPHADANKDGTEDACRAVTVNLGKKSGVCSPEAIATHELCQGGIDDTKCFDRGFDKDNDKSLSDSERTSCKAGLEFQCCYDLAQPVHGGSRCDTFKQRCTLPYRHRKVRPLAWYYTNGSNQFFFNSTEWATHDHDVAMRHAIMVSRYAECMATARDKDWCLKGNVDAEGNGVAGDNFDGEPIAMIDGQPRAKGNPVYFGQMDDHLEAQQLAKEVDDCRHGMSYTGNNGQEDYGPINSEEREGNCIALATTVAEARGAEGRIDEGVIKLAAMPEQIVLCHSPVEADDPAICGPSEDRLPRGVTAADCAVAHDEHDTTTMDVCKLARNVRRGDLRYHLVNVLDAPQSNSPWGIYTDAEDPLTGETFSAGINVWSHVNDLFSQQMVERARFIKGELSLEQVTEGQYVKDWSRAAEAASGNGSAPKISRHQLDQRLADFVGMDVDEFSQLQLGGAIKKKMRQQREEIREVRAAADAPSTMGAIYDARRKAIVGTEIEAELADPMMQDLAGVTGMPSDIATERASIARGLNPVAQKQLRNMFEQALAQRGTCMYNEAPVPMAMTSLADALEQKFQHVCARRDDAGNCETYYGPFGSSGLTNCSDPGDPASCVANTDADVDFQQERAELMRRYVAERANYGVIVHEMGHSVGERHNFVSSSDAFSYRPQYWQLRTDDGRIDTLCEDYSEDGSCVGPRWFDPMTKNERDNMIWLFMHSSVMDYAGEYTQDFLGLGGYDVAATRMFYGENVAVYADPSYRVNEERAGGVLAKMDNFGGIIGIPTEYNGEDIHYSAMQHHYELISDCAVVDPQTYKPASWDSNIHGGWHPVLDGLIVRNSDGKFTKCKQQPVDYRPWQSLRMPSNTELTNGGQTPEFYRGGPAVDSDKRLRVPYGFATDRWADLGNASVYRHDNGADVYEIFDFLSTQQE